MGENMPWLDDESYAKARWQFKANVREVLKQVFDMYGQGVYIEGATEEVFKLAEDFSLRTRGQDKPISLEYIRRKKRKEAK